jgi:hypothetical protein
LEHSIQSFLNTCHFGTRSWNHTNPHTTQI